MAGRQDCRSGGALCALLLAAGLLWQTVRIDGWPIIGGGYKAQVAALTQQADAHVLNDAKAQAAALMARVRMAGAPSCRRCADDPATDPNPDPRGAVPCLRNE